MEIKREPIKVTIGEKEYVVFDEQHTISDIIRYAASCADIDEVVMLSQIVKEESKHNGGL